jgi:hypothetical protein
VVTVIAVSRNKKTLDLARRGLHGGRKGILGPQRPFVRWQNPKLYFWTSLNPEFPLLHMLPASLRNPTPHASAVMPPSIL